MLPFLFLCCLEWLFVGMMIDSFIRISRSAYFAFGVFRGHAHFSPSDLSHNRPIKNSTCTSGRCRYVPYCRITTNDEPTEFLRIFSELETLTQRRWEEVRASNRTQSKQETVYSSSLKESIIFRRYFTQWSHSEWPTYMPTSYIHLINIVLSLMPTT
jgi:hypothetical protein